MLGLFGNKPRKSRTRLLVQISLLLTLILLSFLISGATSPGLAVKGTYILKLHYLHPGESPRNNNKDNDKGKDNEDTPGTDGTKRVPSIPPIGLPGQPRTNEISERTIEERGDAEFDVITFDNAIDPPIIAIHRRADPDELTTPQMDIHLGFYGMCVTPYRSTARCIASRASSREVASLKLFPSLDGRNQTVGTSLTADQDPGDLLGLAVDIQKALSPVPIALAIIATGAALICAVIGQLVAGRNRLYPQLGAGGVWDKAIVAVAGVGFMMLLIAVINMKVAGDLTAGILDGGVAGVVATPGYHGLRIGVTCLVWLGLVAVVGGWWVVVKGGEGVKQSPGREEGGTGKGLRKLFAGRGRRDEGPQWKETISRPVPLKVPARGGVHVEYV